MNCPPTGSEPLEDAITCVRDQIIESPEIALILGSGLGALAETVTDPIILDTSSIPGYARSTVPGHQGRLIFGMLGGRRVVVIQGRIHLYEGYAPEKVVFPVRLVAALGAEALIVTNAAGGINRPLKPGSLMWITDHIDWSFSHPDRVSTLSRTRKSREFYDAEWIRQASTAALDAGIETTEGTYLWTRGPSYETPAEIRAFQVLGADAVGMSTVPEVVEARDRGMRVAGLSTITNFAAGISGEQLDHSEVLEVGKRVRNDLEKLIHYLIEFAP